MREKIIFIVGPTAVGKTEMAIKAAQHIDSEIVSADSMQLYRYMDIGSAKPTAEERAAAKHHLVDEIDPAEPFSVAEYVKMAENCIAEIYATGRIPVISGGTGLYVHALLYDMDFSEAPADEGLRTELKALCAENGPEALHDILKSEDPKAAERIHPNNVKKVIRAIEASRNGKKVQDFADAPVRKAGRDVLMIGLNRDREELYRRIDLRVDLMLEAGLENEVRSLQAMGLTRDMISMKGIGYREMFDYIDGETDIQETSELIKRNSRRYAKRQLTWFRRYDDMNWIDLSSGKEAAEQAVMEMIDNFIDNK